MATSIQITPVEPFDSIKQNSITITRRPASDRLATQLGDLTEYGEQLQQPTQMSIIDSIQNHRSYESELFDKLIEVSSHLHFYFI